MVRMLGIREITGPTLVERKLGDCVMTFPIGAPAPCSSKNSPLITQLARELESRNLSSLRFDFSGNGGTSVRDSQLAVSLSTHLRSAMAVRHVWFCLAGESDGVFGYANYIKEAQDLRAAVLFMRNDLGRRVVAVAGHSLSLIHI